jgi:hypothetical protein
VADASIANFLNRNTRTVTAIVDQTFARLLEPITVLDRYMPTKNYISRKLLLLKFKGHRPTIASVVAEEQEIPPSRPRATLDEDLLGNLKLGKKLVFKARDFEMMNELMRYSLEAGPLAEQMTQEIKKYFFGLVADLVPPLIEKHTVLTMQIATTGTCTFIDPLTGARVELTYPNTIATNLPAALAGNNRWSQPATATPLANLQKHATDYYTNLVQWPYAVMLHFDTLRQIAETNEAKVAYLSTVGATTGPADTSGVYLKDEQVIDMIRARTRCQTVEIFDAQYSEEQENGDVIDKFFLPDNYYLFARENYMERALVPTVEKDFQPGVFLHSKIIEEAPRQERSVAVANGIPLVADERYIAARKVA